MQLELYVHFPFCKSKCQYCDFCSFTAPRAEVEAYGMLLQQEIRLAARRYGETEISTVFLGGGTPSVLPPKVMDGVLESLTQSFSLAQDVEFTSEANPGTLTEEWMAVVRRYGVNRLSLGVQASQEGLLKTLGRIHSFQDARESVEMARKHGIYNLNIDMMFGLPGQSARDYLQALVAAHGLEPMHISAYSLILEEGTGLFGRVRQGKLAVPDEDEAAEMYELGAAWLSAHGYAQYEISNFAREGYECRHNLGYWQGAWYLGLGLGAHSMLPKEAEMDAAYLRTENTSQMEAYRSMLESGKPPIEKKMHVSPAEAMFETIMLGLRTTAGIASCRFEERHGKSLDAAFGKAIEGLISEGLGVWRDDPSQGGSFALTPKGLLVQNAVLLRFMSV